MVLSIACILCCVVSKFHLENHQWNQSVLALKITSGLTNLLTVYLAWSVELVGLATVRFFLLSWFEAPSFLWLPFFMLLFTWLNNVQQLYIIRKVQIVVEMNGKICMQNSLDGDHWNFSQVIYWCGSSILKSLQIIFLFSWIRSDLTINFMFWSIDGYYHINISHFSCSPSVDYWCKLTNIYSYNLDNL